MKVVLFGAAGFLGREVRGQLVAAGHAVVGVDRAPAEGLLVADITQPQSLDGLSFDCDVVVNLAARVPTTPSTLTEHREMFEVNAIGAANVAHWAVKRGANRLVFGSTLVVTNRPWPVPLTESAPTSPTGPVAAYAASKLGGELVAGSIMRAAQRSFSAVRFSAMYGPGMVWIGVLPAFIDAARAGKRLTATVGAHADFVHVVDAARATVAAVSAQSDGVFNVAAGVETSIVELARTVLTACGRSADDLDQTPGLVARALVDVTRLRSELSVASGLPLSEGIASVLRAPS
ncbi:MAG: NAD(P)-dependent oxidoreductase [Archangiaceae bacterium]|nr:NAD(P)-dependent oxidoreductase [Archangiaceae bacterium]